jgi:photosystem II stability/assembly factor-like uncharacterized protein
MGPRVTRRFAGDSCLAQEAYLLSAGVGEDSRIYKTVDGGTTWELQFKNENPSAFYDCFDFWSPNRGITMSDAVDGLFPVIRTRNGEDWRLIARKLPPAQPGEAAFAASGTCVATQAAWRRPTPWAPAPPGGGAAVPP